MGIISREGHSQAGLSMCQRCRPAGWVRRRSLARTPRRPGPKWRFPAKARRSRAARPGLSARKGVAAAAPQAPLAARFEFLWGKEPPPLIVTHTPVPRAGPYTARLTPGPAPRTPGTRGEGTPTSSAAAAASNWAEAKAKARRGRDLALLLQSLLCRLRQLDRA